jgi:hypothetical protein
MSGNLKILPHKSWHVWKRENVEKVCKDEREFKEDNEAKELKQKGLTQEKNLELLLASQSKHLPPALKIQNDHIEDTKSNSITLSNINNDSDINNKETLTNEEPFRLFGDIEELDKRNKEIKDQQQAKKDKELLDKKRSGEAPWALGEGAAEKIGSVVPYWYAKPSAVTQNSSTTSSSSSSSSSASVANGRRNFRATTDSNAKEKQEMNSKETTNQIVNRIKSEWGGEAVEEEALRKREDQRKYALDPMSRILKSENKTNDSIKIGSEKYAAIKIEKMNIKTEKIDENIVKKEVFDRSVVIKKEKDDDHKESSSRKSKKRSRSEKDEKKKSKKRKSDNESKNDHHRHDKTNRSSSHQIHDIRSGDITKDNSKNNGNDNNSSINSAGSSSTYVRASGSSSSSSDDRAIMAINERRSTAVINAMVIYIYICLYI